MLGLATNRCCRTAGAEQPVNQTAMRLRPANKRFRRAAALFRIVGLVAMLCTYKRTDEAVYSLQNKKTFAAGRGAGFSGAKRSPWVSPLLKEVSEATFRLPW